MKKQNKQGVLEKVKNMEEQMNNSRKWFKGYLNQIKFKRYLYNMPEDKFNELIKEEMHPLRKMQYKYYRENKIKQCLIKYWIFKS